MTVNPIKGWALGAAASIDIHCPGFLGHFVRAGAERRQAIAAHLAKRRSLWASDSLDSPARIAFSALAITSGSTRSIFETAYQSCPTGMLGALEKSGNQPYSADYYVTLHRILSSERASRSNARRCVQQLRTLSDKRLCIITKLADDLRHPAIVEALSEPAAAADLMWLWRQLLRNGEDQRQLLHSIRQAARAGSLADFALTWAGRVSFPPHPIPAGDNYLPLTTGNEVRATAMRFRNCAAEMLPALLEGTRHLGVYRSKDGPEVMIELRRTPRGVCLEGVHARCNATVEPTRRREAVSFVTAHGVYPRFMPDAGRWQVLRRLGACSQRWNLI